MSRRPTRPITWQFILRTFKRVDMIASRHSAKSIAKALVERGAALGCSSEYLSDIWYYMRETGEAPS
jgi:hypothetical protein